jgi:hypothetical protein
MKRRKLLMSSSNLIRWSGLVALIGGVLFVILDVVDFISFGNQPFTAVATTGVWTIAQGAYIVAAIFITLGLVGLYVCQAQQTGTLGLVAFVVTFIGGMMATGSTWSEAFFGPWLSEAAPELMEANPAGSVITGAILSYLLFALGWFLFGLASLRAKVLPRGAAVLLMIGAVVFLVLGFLDLPFAGVVFGAAVAWLGSALWSSSSNSALVSKTA